MSPLATTVVSFTYICSICVQNFINIIVREDIEIPVSINYNFLSLIAFMSPHATATISFRYISAINV